MKKLLTLITACLFSVLGMQADETLFKMTVTATATKSTSTQGVVSLSGDVSTEGSTALSSYEYYQGQTASESSTVKYINKGTNGVDLRFTADASYLYIKLTEALKENDVITFTSANYGSNEYGFSTSAPTAATTSLTTTSLTYTVTASDVLCGKTELYINTATKGAVVGFKTLTITRPTTTYELVCKDIAIPGADWKDGDNQSLSSTAVKSISYETDNNNVTVAPVVEAEVFKIGSANHKIKDVVPFSLTSSKTYHVTLASNVKSAKLYCTRSSSGNDVSMYYDCTNDTPTTGTLDTNKIPNLDSTTPYELDLMAHNNFNPRNAVYAVIEIQYNDVYDHANVKVAPIKWSPLYLPFAVTIPSGIKAYYAKSFSDNVVTLSEISGTIPANTGVVVNAEADTYTFNAAMEAAAAITDNLFSGVTAETSSQDYIMSGVSSNTPKFTKSDAGATLTAYAAYLPKDNVSGATGDEITSVIGGTTPTLSSISVKTAPTKTTYTAGDKFDPTGLVITETFSDNSTADVTYSDATKSGFTFSPTTETTLATTDVKVTITYGGRTVDQAITVNAAPTGPTITTQPASANYTAGDAATALTVAATASSGDLSYQWYSNTTESTEGATKIDGATTASYTPSTATAGTTYYYCVVTDDNGPTNSSFATIQVVANVGTIKTIDGTTTTWDFTKVTQAQGATLTGWTDVSDSKYYKSPAITKDDYTTTPNWCTGIAIGAYGSNSSAEKIRLYYDEQHGIYFGGGAASIKVTIPTEANTIEIYSSIDNLTSSTSGISLGTYDTNNKKYTVNVTNVSEIEIHRNNSASGSTAPCITKVVTKYAEYYTVTCNPATNGTVTSDAPTAGAVSGTKVKLTIKGDTGYGLAAISIKDASNNDVTFAAADSSFIMPESNVTVTATFKKVPDLKIPEGKSTLTIVPTATYTLTTGTDYTTTSTGAITYSSDTEGVATVDASTGVITGVAEGTAKITLKQAASDTYAAGSVEYTVTVKGAALADKFGTPTTALDLTQDFTDQVKDMIPDSISKTQDAEAKPCIVFSAYSMYNSYNNEKITWANVPKEGSSAGGGSDIGANWDANGVFRGGAAYKQETKSGGVTGARFATTNASKDSRCYSFRVKGTTKVAALVNASRSNTVVNMAAYEITENIAAKTTTLLAKTTTIAAETLSLDLDATKEYLVTFDNNIANNSIIYEIALYSDNLPTLSSIAVKTPPTKTEYYAGKKFDPAGLVITKTYSDETTADVAYPADASAFTFVPSLDTELQTTDTKVTITYQGQSVEQAIAVAKKVQWETPTLTVGDWDATNLAYPVTITGEEGATLKYSTNGTDYSDYTTPVNVAADATIYAKATGGSYTDSEVASKTMEGNPGTIKTVDETTKTTTWDFTAVTQLQGKQLKEWTETASSYYFCNPQNATYLTPSWCDGIAIGASASISANRLRLYYKKEDTTPAQGLVFMNSAAGSMKVTIPTGANTLEIYSDMDSLTTSTEGITSLGTYDIANKKYSLQVTEGSEIEIHRDYKTGSIATGPCITKIVTKVMDYTPRTVTCNTATHGTITAEPTSNVIPGTKVKLTIKADENYNLEVLSVKAGENDVTFAAADSSFIMPESDVTVTATFKTTSDLKIPEGKSALTIAPTATYTLAKDVDYTTSSTGTITYSSSDEAVATVGTDGKITGVAEGTATITLSQAGDDTYAAASVEYTVTVKGAALADKFGMPTKALDLSSDPAEAMKDMTPDGAHVTGGEGGYLVFSAYSMMNSYNNEKITWANVPKDGEKAGGTSDVAQEGNWAAEAPFLGGAAYTQETTTKGYTGARFATTNTDRNYTAYSFRVKGANKVAALVNSTKTSYIVNMAAYEITEGTAAKTTTLLAKTTTGAAETVTLTLDAAKEYLVTLDNSFNANSRLYEIALYSDNLPVKTKWDKPTFTLGAYNGEKYSITIASETGSTMKYTVGSEAEKTSTSNPIVVSAAPATVIKATATGTGYDDSEEATYTVPDAQKVSAPTFTIADYDYINAGYPVKVSCATEGATLTYSLNSGEYSDVPEDNIVYVPGKALFTVKANKEGWTQNSNKVTVNVAPSATSPETLIPVALSDGYVKDIARTFSSVNFAKTCVAGVSTSTNKEKELKLRTNATGDGTNANTFQLMVNSDYIVTKVDVKAFSNNAGSETKSGKVKMTGISVDGTPQDFTAVEFPVTATEQTYATASTGDITATNNITFTFDNSNIDSSTDGAKNAQIIAEITVYYKVTSQTSEAGKSSWENAEGVSADKTKYTQTLDKGKFSTICLPYAATVTGGVIYKLVNKVEGTYIDPKTQEEKTGITSLIFEFAKGTSEAESNEVEGGMAYLVKSTATDGKVVYTKTNETAADVLPVTDTNGFTGVYAPIRVTKDAYFFYNEVDANEQLTGKQYFTRSNGYVQANAFRAYIKNMDDVQNKETAGAKTTIIGLAHSEETTAIEAVGAAAEVNVDTPNNGKFFKNGQLIIVKNGKQYTSAGLLIK